jgi:hypothetical protein
VRLERENWIMEARVISRRVRFSARRIAEREGEVLMEGRKGLGFG